MYYSTDVADKINYLIKKNNLSQKEVLNKCGLNKNTISTMLSRGSMPKADTIAKIADLLCCSMDYLLGRTNNPEINNTPYIEETPKITRKIPLSFLAASAGLGTYLFDDYDIAECETIEIDASAFPTAAIAIKVHGDSMLPKYKDGDIVLVNDQSTLSNGDIGIFVVDGEGYIKKFHVDQHNNQTLVSLNPDYKPIALTDKNDVRVIGRVLCTL